ncbi:hypothetical protein [Microbacterium maritypicum]
MRNMLEGWGERGTSWAEAAAALRADVQPWWEDSRWDEDPDDRRAALTVWLFTGMVPERRDFAGAGDSRADLLLTAEDGHREVVEVMTTIDASFQHEQTSAARLVEELNQSEHRTSIPVSLEGQWTPPRTKKGSPQRKAWQETVRLLHEETASTGKPSPDTVRKLERLFVGLQVGEPSEDEEPRGFHLASILAKVQDHEGVPYLDLLTRFLQTDRQAVRHVEKVKREVAATGSTRGHLYLLVASTGQHGHLLPISPSYLTDGTFEPPDGVDELWLDGGTSHIFRWQREHGWTYHEMS